MLVVAYFTSSVAITVEQLGLMGFDEPRSHLIAALVMGAVAAAVGAGITGQRWSATLLGPIGWVALFWATLRQETTSALNASGLDGVFDPVGYAFSLLTFVVIALVFAWAAASIAIEIRRAILRAWRRLRVTNERKRDRRWAIARLGTLVVALAVTAACFGLFADMINYTPDVSFVRGGQGHVGLTGVGANTGGGTGGDPGDLGSAPPGQTVPPLPTPGPGATPSPSAPPAPPAVPIEEGGTLSITDGAIANLQPGHFGGATGAPAKIVQADLPAPWNGGYSDKVTIFIRLPIGYDAKKKYPVVYETPQPYSNWSNALRINSTVDQLEGSGDIPPMIYVFAAPAGSPHAVTMCIDSKDGTEWWDTFMSTTLVQWMDKTYSTIASPAARIITGSSQGGYCAADLLMRHPDVWNSTMAFDGFYDAAPRLPNTQGGAEVYGGDQALMSQYSPIDLAPNMAADARSKLFLVLAGLSSQDFFGPQLDQFTGILRTYGYANAVIQSPYGHSWKTPEAFLPRALTLIAGRLVKEGVVP